VVLADGREIGAAACVAAVPPQQLLPLLPSGWRERAPELVELERFRPSPYVCTYIWFDRKLTDERFWNRVYSPESLNYDSYDLSNIREGWSDRASVIASNIMYSDRVGHLTDEEILARTVEELTEFLPEIDHARVRHARVHRVPMGVPCPDVRTERIRPGARSALHGIYLAGDWTRTQLPASMESAARSGWLAAEAVLAGLGKDVRLAVRPRETEGLPGIVRKVATRARARRGAMAT
jgi:uncharacterized protein with NAD-binding domain and iron-sulfur cluster